MVRRKYWLLKPKRKATNDEGNEEVKPEKKKNEKNEKKVTAVVIKKKTVVEIQSIKDAENRMREIRKNFMKLHNQ